MGPVVEHGPCCLVSSVNALQLRSAPMISLGIVKDSARGDARWGTYMGLLAWLTRMGVMQTAAELNRCGETLTVSTFKADDLGGVCILGFVWGEGPKTERTSVVAACVCY